MKKILSLLLVVCCIFTVTACGYKYKIAYDAKINSHANDIIATTFLENNQISLESDTKTFLITDLETYKEIFTDKAESIDFNKKMAVLHIFMDIYPSRDYHIEKLSKEDDVLEIHFAVEKNKWAGGDAAQPSQRSILVIMDKVDISTVTMIKN